LSFKSVLRTIGTISLSKKQWGPFPQPLHNTLDSLLFSPTSPEWVWVHKKFLPLTD